MKVQVCSKCGEKNYLAHVGLHCTCGRNIKDVPREEIRGWFGLNPDGTPMENPFWAFQQELIAKGESVFSRYASSHHSGQ